MKHLCKLLLVLVIITGTFSCSKIGTMSVIKRHYRDGYYVSNQAVKRNPGRNSHKQEKNELGLSFRGNTFCYEIGGQQVAGDLKTTVGGNEQNEVDKSLAVNTGVENKIKEDRKKRTDRTNLYPEAGKINVHHEKPVSIIKNKIEESKTKLNSKVASWEVANLLWIVAIVILVLWLLAFLSGGWGLGGLVHLLLVIALILFVIWLIKAL